MSAQWEPTSKHQKQYPHFDAPLSRQMLSGIANDPAQVAANAFFPFLQFKKSWIPFRADGYRDPKERLIRFASRRDSVIFSRYRSLLSDLYEDCLKSAGLDESVIAYRQIPVNQDSWRGKCNIHFAKEAFESIQELENCCAVVMDISKYFENIDHDRLKQCWAGLLSEPRLPKDHYAVYNALTQHRWVDRFEVLKALGYVDSDGHRMVSEKDMPKQLCTPQEFREKIVNASLIQKNDHGCGIPQGAPLSDVLANLYLLEFDTQLAEWVGKRDGVYRRYSDDIFIVIPGGFKQGQEAFEFASSRITTFGKRLKIKKEKTSIVRYFSRPEGLQHECLSGSKGKNGLEYLGFRFDGKQVYLRDSTVSRFFRKMKLYCRREAIGLIKRYPEKSLDYILSKVNVDEISKRYGKVEAFDPHDTTTWTFWTYARRSSDVFGDMGRPIMNQVSGYRKFIQRCMDAELSRRL